MSSVEGDHASVTDVVVVDVAWTPVTGCGGVVSVRIGAPIGTSEGEPHAGAAIFRMYHVAEEGRQTAMSVLPSPL